MKNPFMLRSTHEAEVKTISKTFRDAAAVASAQHSRELKLASDKCVALQNEIDRLNDLLAKTVAPEPDEPTDEQAKEIKDLEKELESIEQTIKLTEDEKVVVMKGRRRKTQALTDLIRRRGEVADKLAKARAPRVEQ